MYKKTNIPFGMFALHTIKFIQDEDYLEAIPLSATNSTSSHPVPLSGVILTFLTRLLTAVNSNVLKRGIANGFS